MKKLQYFIMLIFLIVFRLSKSQKKKSKDESDFEDHVKNPDFCLDVVQSVIEGSPSWMLGCQRA